MIKRLFLAFMAVIAGVVSTPAIALPWTVGPQPITYTNMSRPLLAPNTAPAYAYEDADIPSNFTVSTWTNPSGSAGGQYDAPGSGAQEAKARFDCNDTFESRDDPFLAFGIPGGGPHDHTFFGNTAAALEPWNVTYSSLRSKGNSTCYGGPINRSLYWEPSVKEQLANGAIVSKRVKNIVTYYEGPALNGAGSGTISDPNRFSRWPRGIGMIEGWDFEDSTGEKRINDVIAAANAAYGGTRYGKAPKTMGGFAGWKCASGNGSIATSPRPGDPRQPWLKNADGTPTLNCPIGTGIMAELVSAPCWDGVNLASPDMRDHFMPFIIDLQTGQPICPDNWVRVITFRAIVEFTHEGQADYTEWWFSSDRMDPNPANWKLNGQTGHFDFLPAWDYGTSDAPGIFLDFVVNCNGHIVKTGTGATIPGNPHECGTGRVSLTKQVWPNDTASPDGSQPSPVVVLNPNRSGKNAHFPPLPGTKITGSITHHHGAAPMKYVVAEGDSLSLNSATFYPFLYDSSRANVTVCGQAIGGSGIVNGGNGSVQDRFFQIIRCGDGKPKVLTLLIGTNDLPADGVTVGGPHPTRAQWFAKVWAYTAQVRAQGIKVAMGTILPKGIGGGGNGNITAFNESRAIANATIRAAVGTHIDAVIDFAADPTIGTDAAGADTAKYPDGVHPASSVHTIMNTIYTPVVDALLAGPSASLEPANDNWILPVEYDLKAA